MTDHPTRKLRTNKPGDHVVSITQNHEDWSYKKHLLSRKDLAELLRDPEFVLRRGNTETLRLMYKAKLKVASQFPTSVYIRMLDSLAICGIHSSSQRVFFCLRQDFDQWEVNAFVAEYADAIIAVTEGNKYYWKLGGFFNHSDVSIGDRELVTPGEHIYCKRDDKTESASDYLRRVYKEELERNSLTLSDLRKIDESLWRALRNWAHAGKHDLDALIPRGKTTPGRALVEVGFDATTLNPDDPKDALLLRGLRARENSRQTSAAYRSRKRLES